MGFGKRIDKPGGSRRAVRQEAMVRTAMMTMTDSLDVDLLDLTKFGARLRGKDLPAPGLDVLVLVGSLEAFATVIWRDEDECGVHFDIPLTDSAVAAVESERRQAALLGCEPDSMLAAEDWLNGLAR